MPSRIQYQPLTGPVWREPVASRMAWLPEGQPRTPALTPNAVGSYVLPFVAAFAVATSLAWVPSGNAQAQAAPSARVAWSVIAPFQPPTSFDPSQFPATLFVRSVPLELRRPSEAVAPFTAALYRPDGLQWTPAGTASAVRPAPRSIQTWSLLSPLPAVAPFDPATFPWISVTLFRALERRAPGGIVQPITQALYQPAGLQWLPRGNVPWRSVVANRLGWIVGDPLPHTAVIISLPLEVEDRSGFRYGVLDQSTKRYLVIEQSSSKLKSEDDST